MSETHLLVMAKPAVSGKVKTRLAAGIGDKDALEVYRLLLRTAFQAATDSKLNTTVHWAFKDEGATCPFACDIQKGDALGERMEKAFVKHGQGARLMIGTDCPGLNANLLLTAARALEKADVVFGPAQDGGYYLIGIKGEKPQLFEGIPWSTSAVLTRSLEVCREMDWRVELLPTLRDIDTFADLLAEGFAPEIAARHVQKT